MLLLYILLRFQGYINGSIVSITMEVISLYLKLVRASLRHYFTLVAAFEEMFYLEKQKLKDIFCVKHFLWDNGYKS